MKKLILIAILGFGSVVLAQFTPENDPSANAFKGSPAATQAGVAAVAAPKPEDCCDTHAPGQNIHQLPDADEIKRHLQKAEGQKQQNEKNGAEK